MFKVISFIFLNSYFSEKKVKNKSEVFITYVLITSYSRLTCVRTETDHGLIHRFSKRIDL